MTGVLLIAPAALAADEPLAPALFEWDDVDPEDGWEDDDATDD